MKLIAALLPVLFLGLFSCKKNSDATGVPAFTCDNASDDGRNEHWDNAVKWLFPADYVVFKNTDGAGVSDISISATHFTYSDSLTISYRQTQPLTIIALVAYRVGDRIFTSAPHVSKNIGSNVAATVWGHAVQDTAALPGCNRLYYVFADSLGREVSKGHFDIQLVQ